MKSRKTLVLVSGLVLCAGCAMEDRWTLDSKPRHTHHTSTTTESTIHSSKEKASAKAPARQSAAMDAAQDLELVQQKDGMYAIHNKNVDKNMVATVRITTTNASGWVQGTREILVLVLAGSTTQVGTAGDPHTGEQWAYSLVSADYQ